jgi:hypothetical protein
VTRPVRVDPEARDEIAAAVSWYDAQTGAFTLGSDLLDAVGLGLAQVGARAASFPPVPGVSEQLLARQCSVGRFPFRLVFIELAEEVRVIAFAHVRRRPGYWRERI